MKRLLILTALVAAPALAQAPAAAPAAKATPKAARTPAVRTQKSLDCSRQADVQNVHGKPRKAFMAKCKKA